MRKIVVVCVVLGLGVLVTLLSGLYMRDVSKLTGIKDLRYGLPIAWYGQQGTNSSDNVSVWFAWDNFILDVALWSIVIGLIASFAIRRRPR